MRPAAHHALEERLEQTPPRCTSIVARGQRENAMQMIGEYHRRGQLKRMAIAAGAKYQSQYVHVFRECGRALVFERGSEEVVDGSGLTAAIGIHAALWRGDGAAV